MANSVHVTALADRDRCASRIVRRFVRTLAAGDTACATEVAPVRVVDAFPTVAREAPASGIETIAAQTLADVIQRWQLNYSGRIHGLRGGWATYADDANVETFRLSRVRFAANVVVSGRATWHTRSGGVRGRLRVQGPGGARGVFRMTWSMQGPHATATITGTRGRRGRRGPPEAGACRRSPNIAVAGSSYGRRSGPSTRVASGSAGGGSTLPGGIGHGCGPVDGDGDGGRRGAYQESQGVDSGCGS
jgi:hypothetical protein